MGSTQKAVGRFALIAVCGFAAGTVNGLLGAGSGVLLVYALRAILARDGADPRDIFANATAVILPLSLCSALLYFRTVPLPPLADLIVYLLPGVIGGLVGARLLGRLPATALRRIFGTVVLVSGLTMLFR